MVETLETAEATAPTAVVEAVIISGPRRGEIVQLAEDSIPEISEEELKLLNAGLDQVEAALGRFEATVESAIEQFSAPPKGA
jgi:hypothetical protein